MEQTLYEAAAYQVLRFPTKKVHALPGFQFSKLWCDAMRKRGVTVSKDAQTAAPREMDRQKKKREAERQQSERILCAPVATTI